MGGDIGRAAEPVKNAAISKKRPAPISGKPEIGAGLFVTLCRCRLEHDAFSMERILSF
jgi:hypothetical protein